MNEPYQTSPVTVTFSAGCASCIGNQYGKWEVVGNFVTVDEDNPLLSYDQIGTLYRVGNTWIKMG